MEANVCHQSPHFAANFLLDDSAVLTEVLAEFTELVITLNKRNLPVVFTDMVSYYLREPASAKNTIK